MGKKLSRDYKRTFWLFLETERERERLREKVPQKLRCFPKWFRASKHTYLGTPGIYVTFLLPRFELWVQPFYEKGSGFPFHGRRLYLTPKVESSLGKVLTSEEYTASSPRKHPIYFFIFFIHTLWWMKEDFAGQQFMFIQPIPSPCGTVHGVWVGDVQLNNSCRNFSFACLQSSSLEGLLRKLQPSWKCAGLFFPLPSFGVNRLLTEAVPGDFSF